MNSILIIWDGVTKPLSVWRLSCIARVREVYPEMRLTVLTKKPELFPDCDILLWDSYKERLWKEFYIRRASPTEFSDYARLLYLSENAYSLYLDTDAYLKRRVVESEDLAQFGRDISVLWSGAEVGFFKHALANRFGNTLRDILDQFPYDTLDLSEFVKHKA